MSNGMKTPDPGLDNDLRRGLRPGSLSRKQRQRHLDRIYAKGAWEMDFVRRRSGIELGVVAAVLLLAVAIGAWQSGLFAGNEEEEAPVIAGAPTPTSVAVGQMPTATIPPTTAASSCNVSHIGDLKSPAGANIPGFEDWYEGDGMAISAPTFAAVNPMFPASSHRWFTGNMLVLLFLEGHSPPVYEARHLSNPDATFSYVLPPDLYFPVFHSILNFSDPGCWELKVTSDHTSVDLVIDVQPAFDRPDYIALFENWQRTMPHAVPSSCRTTPVVLEDRDGSLASRFWLDGEHISMSNRFGLFWQDEPNETYWITSDGRIDIDLSGRLEGNPNVQMDLGISSELVTTSLLQDRIQRTELIFPEPGCWTIEATAGGITEELIIYVFPARQEDEPAG